MVGRLTAFAFCALAIAQAFASGPMLKAEYLPPGDVRVRGGAIGRTYAAAKKKLLAVRPETLLCAYRRAAGLPAKSAPMKTPRETSRETEGRSLGHYLSAVSTLCAVPRNDDARDRVDYVVEELFECAKASRSHKFVMTVPEEEAFTDFSPTFPARTAYAMLKGLIDARDYADNGRAFWVARDCVDVYRDVWWRSKPQDRAKTDGARAKWVAGDWGGLNRVFVDVYRLFGLVDYYHDAWNCFNQVPYFDRLRKGEYDFTAEGAASFAAKVEGMYMRHRVRVWDELKKISFAYLDYARKTPKYGAGDDEAAFDLISLAQRAFEEEPSAELMDFIDAKGAELSRGVKANEHIGPAEIYAVRAAHCAYATSPRTIWVNQYIPSQALFREKRILLAAETDYPSESSAKFTVRLKGRPKFQRIKFRSVKGVRPKVSVNGTPVVAVAGADGYVTVEGNWNNKDVIVVSLR